MLFDIVIVVLYCYSHIMLLLYHTVIVVISYCYRYNIMLLSWLLYCCIILLLPYHTVNVILYCYCHKLLHIIVISYQWHLLSYHNNVFQRQKINNSNFFTTNNWKNRVSSQYFPFNWRGIFNRCILHRYLWEWRLLCAVTQAFIHKKQSIICDFIAGI